MEKLVEKLVDPQPDPLAENLALAVLDLLSCCRLSLNRLSSESKDFEARDLKRARSQSMNSKSRCCCRRYCRCCLRRNLHRRRQNLRNADSQCCFP